MFKNIAVISKKMCFFRKTKNSVYSKYEIKGNRCTFCTKKDGMLSILIYKNSEEICRLPKNFHIKVTIFANKNAK